MIQKTILFFLSFSIVFGTENNKFQLKHNSPLKNVTICEIKSRKPIDIYTEKIKLQCDWKNFVDALTHTPIYDFILNNELINKKKRPIYELEFIAKEQLPNEIKYHRISSNMFENLLIKDLSLTNLGIKQIESESFSKRCCHDTLESLDLSGNKLIRLEPKLFMNLGRLERVNLSNNHIQFKDKNFEFNKNLLFIDLSNNGLQYLPPKIFHNLHEIESINLDNNHLISVQSCTFSQIQSKVIVQEFRPAKIALNNNPIDCNCDLFYLNRFANFKLSLQCDMPKHYSGRNFSSLKLEDPSKSCDYLRIAKRCDAASHFTIEKKWIIGVLIVIFCLFIVSLCSCFANAKQVKKFKKINKELEDVKKQTKTKHSKPLFMNRAMNSDGECLIEA